MNLMDVNSAKELQLTEVLSHEAMLLRMLNVWG